MNILGLSGYSWPRAPLKWQVLDVAYLLLDILVVVGLIFAWRIGLIAFFIAAVSQIFLYTVLRTWITDGRTNSPAHRRRQAPSAASSSSTS